MPRPRDELSQDELQRYHRHIILPHVGEDGQKKLRNARVLLVGAGGLGSPVALYLAAAGVGHIGIVDADVVEISNLQRQVVHDTKSVGKPKAESARTRLLALNPLVDVTAHASRLSAANALALIGDYDIVVDGSDNFPTRYLVSDACVLLNKPNVYGSVLRFDGQASVFTGTTGPCYRCVFPEPPAPGTVPNCESAGVLGVLPGLIGCIQATEALKIILGTGDTLEGRLLLVNALRMEFKPITIERNPECPSCGTREITALIDYDEFCGIPKPAMEYGIDDMDDIAWDEITPRGLQKELENGTGVALIDVREPYEWAIGRIPQARLVPLNALPAAVASLDRSANTIVYCHHGTRSAAAVAWLQDQGFSRVRNLVGGINRWSLDVDSTVKRY